MIIKEKNYLALFAKSFNWAGFFLPKDTYEECSKLYAFCRVLDDLADAIDNISQPKQDNKATIMAWKKARADRLAS